MLNDQTFGHEFLAFGTQRSALAGGVWPVIAGPGPPPSGTSRPLPSAPAALPLLRLHHLKVPILHQGLRFGLWDKALVMKESFVVLFSEPLGPWGIIYCSHEDT